MRRVNTAMHPQSGAETDNDSGYVVWGLGCRSIAKTLLRNGLRLHSMRSLSQFFRQTDAPAARCILLHPGNLRQPLASGIRALRRQWPLIDIIVWAPKASAQLVRNAFLAGAKDVILSNSADKVVELVEERIEAQRFLPRIDEYAEGQSGSNRFGGMVTRSPKMWELFEACLRIAETDATVLITGETGTGKELLARAIHRYSKREGSFVVVNCGAIPEHLIDSELFGYAKGAFTGAIKDQEGLFQHADKGTLLLDELGNIPLEVQFRLLRTLQEGTVRPIGAQQEVPIDVRVLAATNAPIEQMVQDGSFREDLYFRLNVIQMHIPPLRERPEDILFLSAHFMKLLSEHYNIGRPDLQDDFLDALVEYDWPGNVRQMEHFIERLLLTHANQKMTAQAFQDVIDPYEFAAQAEAKQEPGPGPLAESPPVWEREQSLDQGLDACLTQAERTYLEACLLACNGHVSQSAALAQISRRSFTRKMKQHELLKDTYKKPTTDNK